MSKTTFKRALALFPIRNQEEINLAAKLLREIRRKTFTGVDSDIHPRALALLSYVISTAHLDGWATDNVRCWGPLAALGPNKLAKRAVTLAKQAWLVQQSQGDRAYDYDVLWALAFAYLSRNQHNKARAEFTRALTANIIPPLVPPPPPPPPRVYRDWNLLAEAADAYVYLGVINIANPAITDAEELISEAFRVAEDKLGVGEAPEWFYWVRAWVSFALAALDVNRVANLQSAISDLERILPRDASLESDFDAYALLAAAKWQLGKIPAHAAQQDEAMAIWHEYIDEQRAKRGIDWDEAMESRRALFDNVGHAVTIRDYWLEAIHAVDS